MQQTSEGKGVTISLSKPVFVISDLHIGDASPKDNLCRANREPLLESFLDYVDDQNGQLVILGDFLELLRYPLEGIIAKRGRLLDRLARMEAIYVPGNHDEDAMRWADPNDPPHPFFTRMSAAFTLAIGEKRFKFMHGHEVDPFTSGSIQSVSRIIGAMAYPFNSRQGICVLSNDALTDAILEVGEQVLFAWDWLRRGINRAIRECYYRMPAEEARRLTWQIRTHRMLGRYYQDKAEGLYDIAIVGHTHKAGTFDRWYFNSGSWTGATNNFLRITPDGRVRVFDWSPAGPQANFTVVAN